MKSSYHKFRRVGRSVLVDVRLEGENNIISTMTSTAPTPNEDLPDHPEKAQLLQDAVFFFSSRRRHTRCSRDWSSDVCSSDLTVGGRTMVHAPAIARPPTVYGEWDREVLKAFKLARMGVAPVFGDGSQELSVKIGRASCRERG